MKYQCLIVLGVLLLSQLPAKAQGTGSLSVRANPGRAGVFLDGKYLGPAANFRVARTYSVPAGEHEVKLMDRRYEELTTKVTVQAGKKTTISETLKEIAAPKPPFGKLRIENADKFAAVYGNDRFMGHVDEFSNHFQSLLLNPGEYNVKIVPANGQPVTQAVKIEVGKTVIVK
jgi:hypothetical protein